MPGPACWSVFSITFTKAILPPIAGQISLSLNTNFFSTRIFPGLDFNGTTHAFHFQTQYSEHTAYTVAPNLSCIQSIQQRE